MFSKSILAGAVAAATLAVLPATAAVSPANLVTNGDFETVGVSGNFQFGANGTTGANQLTGWYSPGGYNLLFHSNTATTQSAVGQYYSSGAGREFLNAATASPTGGNFVALDGDAGFASPMYQQINGLTVGQVYTLSFYYAAGQIASRVGGPVTESITAGFGTDLNHMQIFTTPTLTVTNPASSFSGWSLASTNFTATATSQFLGFLSNGTPSGQPPVALLDGVKLTAAVPEPASWAMMIGGFGFIGAALRRSRHAKVALA